MAGILGLAIVLGLLGSDISTQVTRLGVMAAIAVPIIGLIITMFIFFRNNENRHALIAVILLVVLIIAVMWRIYG